MNQIEAMEIKGSNQFMDNEKPKEKVISIQKHFVEFYSPGTFVAETSTKEIDSWDVEKAKEMTREILERYNSKPYAFKFITRGRAEDEMDSRVIDSSGYYYINGKVETLEEIKAKNNSDDRILISNMESNGWNKVVTTFTPWKWTQPFDDTKDFVVEI